MEATGGLGDCVKVSLHISVTSWKADGHDSWCFGSLLVALIREEELQLAEICGYIFKWKPGRLSPGKELRWNRGVNH